ncbi:MAG: pyridoxal-phosphate dependent enzyme [Terriglobia bacterium]|jgi:threonine dehydratase|nr:pyridoxal-phosphate dependent enzyme [Terriglobia bacterium]
MKLDWADIQHARAFVRESFPPTPLQAADSLSDNAKRVYLKNETGLPTGSFKVRGALFALHAETKVRPVKEVVAASTGNHGAAVAWAAHRSEIPAVIFLPKNPNPVKRGRIADLGARIVEAGADISDALAAAREYTLKTGAFMLDDSTSPEVPAGAATIGYEIVEQLPNVAEIWVPMGDTALIRGVAAAAKHLRPSVRMVGVQAKNAPSYYLSWKKGEVVVTETCDTIADGLATRSPVKENVLAIRELVDDVCLVSEEQLLQGIRHLREREGVLAEPAGAATTAAWLAHAGQSRTVESVLVVTGGNIAEEVLRQVS